MIISEGVNDLLEYSERKADFINEILKRLMNGIIKITSSITNYKREIKKKELIMKAEINLITIWT